MPRHPRILFEGAFYHVYNRGNRKERIYLDEYDYARFEAMLFDAVLLFNVRLIRWSLMPNHFHFLVQTPEGNLAAFMHGLLTRYAMWFNRRHRLVGHVFQGRYGARLCDKENYFLELIRYIELNPYRSKKMVVKIGQWKWASHRYFMMPQSQWPAVVRETFKEVLKRFGRDPLSAREAYVHFLAEGLTRGTWEEFYTQGNARFLGDEDFIEEMKAIGEEPVRNQPRDFKRIATLQAWVHHIQKISGLSDVDLKSPLRGKTLSQWRQALVYVGRGWYRFPVKALAAAVGRGATAASEMLRTMRMSPEKNPRIQALINTIKAPN